MLVGKQLLLRKRPLGFARPLRSRPSRRLRCSAPRREAMRSSPGPRRCSPRSAGVVHQGRRQAGGRGRGAGDWPRRHHQVRLSAVPPAAAAIPPLAHVPCAPALQRGPTARLIARLAEPSRFRAPLLRRARALVRAARARRRPARSPRALLTAGMAGPALRLGACNAAP